jgi:inosine-uridine nucleoside N-ribohydrolase
MIVGSDEPSKSGLTRARTHDRQQRGANLWWMPDACACACALNTRMLKWIGEP